MAQIRAHIIHIDNGMLAKASIYSVPRVGDEIRLSGERYFKVAVVVFVFDEPDCPQQRVNIGVTDIVESKDENRS